ncbi:MAG: hypothetical protein J6F30_06290 [Cellulosilyticum sp.]|nr:hypothetical protein [Cellulosilyticum sp.]
MAYTNETTHYSIPLPLGSDLTTPMDYNESMQDVDTALFEAKTDSGSALQKANQLQQDLATTNDNVTAVAGRVTTLEGTSVTQGQAILQNTQDIADVRTDALDMIVAKDEGTAQVATVAIAEGEYFRYNDVLYIATENIAIGDSIIPNENCKATNVGTELSQLNSDLSNKGSVIDGTVDTSITSLVSDDITTIGSITLNSGIYILEEVVTIAGADHGIGLKVGDTNIITIKTPTAYNNMCRGTAIINVATDNTTLDFKIYSDSVASIVGTSTIKAVKL